MAVLLTTGGLFMKKGWIWIVILGLIFSVFGIYQRIEIEQRDKGVQLVIDSQALSEYAEGLNISFSSILGEISKQKVTSLAVSEVKLWEAVVSRSQMVFPGFYFLLSDLEIDSIDPRMLYISDDVSGPINQRLSPLAKLVVINNEIKLWEFQEEYSVDTKRRKEAEREPTVSLWDEALYPDYSLLNLGKGHDLSVVSRIQNPYLQTPESLEYVMKQWDGKGSLIIFQGKEVLGYPNNLKISAKLLEGTPWGFVEFANQYGEKDLARLTDYNLVRVHSITPEEMIKIAPNVAMERYLRAVRERGARVLYLRPFPKLTPVENLDWFSSLATNLENEGYLLEKATPKPFFKSSFITFWLVTLAIIVCGIRLMLLLGFKENISLYSGVLPLLVVTALYLKGYTILARQIAAFGAAVVFPTLAIGSIAIEVKENNKSLLKMIGTVFFYTISGVLLLSAALSDLRFVIKIEQFLGVKLMHILPPLMTFWICIKNLNGGSVRSYNFRDSLKGTLAALWPPRLGHIIVLVLVVFVGFIYIGRTGHDWGIPVLEFEENLRVFLEEIFVIRPRLKESFIGHPALFLGLLVASSVLINKLRWLLPFILTIGSIGVTSVLNTFSHAHTPFLVSLVRTGWGFAIGAILGTLAFLLLKLVVRSDKNG